MHVRLCISVGVPGYRYAGFDRAQGLRLEVYPTCLVGCMIGRKVDPQRRIPIMGSALRAAQQAKALAGVGAHS